MSEGDATANLDPNDALTQRDSPEGVRLVPMAVNAGTRQPVRDFLLATQKELAATGHGDCLTIQSDTLVGRVCWEAKDGQAPRAVGVEVLQGERIYRAYHADPNPAAGVKTVIRVPAKSSCAAAASVRPNC